MSQHEHPGLTLADYIAIRERQNFLVVRVELEQKENVALIKVPEDELAVIAFNKDTRSWLERHDNNKGYWRWPAGGCALFVRCINGQELLLTVYRSESAPTNPNTETIGAGLGSSEIEIAYPIRTAVREGVEEIIIGTDKQVFYPRMSDAFGFDLELQAIAKTGGKLFPEFQNASVVGVPSSFIKLPIAHTIHVEWRGERYTTEGLFDIKENIRGLDVLVALRIDLPCTLAELKCRDGEVVGANLLDRTIRAYEVVNGNVTGKVVAMWEHGKPANPPQGTWPAKLNPSLHAIIKAMNS